MFSLVKLLRLGVFWKGGDQEARLHSDIACIILVSIITIIPSTPATCIWALMNYKDRTWKQIELD